MRLHEALEREQNFSGDVSHEIRNPLNVIEGSLELLEESELSDRQRRQVLRAQKAAHDIHLLVDDFLNLLETFVVSAPLPPTQFLPFSTACEICGYQKPQNGVSVLK